MSCSDARKYSSRCIHRPVVCFHRRKSIQVAGKLRISRSVACSILNINGRQLEQCPFLLGIIPVRTCNSNPVLASFSISVLYWYVSKFLNRRYWLLSSNQPFFFFSLCYNLRCEIDMLPLLSQSETKLLHFYSPIFSLQTVFLKLEEFIIYRIFKPVFITMKYAYKHLDILLNCLNGIVVESASYTLFFFFYKQLFNS